MNERRRPATRTDHENFCITEGWAERKRATGKRGTHHVNYEFALPDGRILYTRISHPVDRTGYGPSIWAHILRDQLAVTAEEFWACVEDKVLPDRQELQVPTDTIPVGVIRVLVVEAHIPEAKVKAMTKAEAIQRLADFYTTGQ
ncbi:cytotoxic translational repressor of toxin-antitoxin stability system [Kribbella speibonae]|uniref:Cytotoxic translational repressor of toxin-antitoxin stability system n=1 Tax=Kribbella speibonae TaxID=1572660 RepID=A0A4V2M5M2_9ACTN|nr:cytotoxic translational repressor of toxin-antitoxin stability system [Kribbella speibonae]TCC40532.1 cytotoxic translational repressor of toxin-antitoxin stability system [Kribbella speibonae]